MNIYNLIIKISQYYKNDNDIINEYNESYKKLQDLRKDMKYYTFFGLVDANSSYYFYAPNVALQIIENIVHTKDYKDIFTEDNCKRIINNDLIKEYVINSTKVNELIINITKKIFISLEDFNNSKENYIYNKCSDELGYIGFGKLLQSFNNSKDLLDTYEKEREKTIHGANFVFPFGILKNGLYQEYEQKENYKETVKNYENFNIILSVINLILFSQLCNKTIEIKKEDIEILTTKQKNNVQKIKFKINNSMLLASSPCLFIIDDELYFSFSKTIHFENNTTDITCECFKINFDKKDSLYDFSINNLSVLL